MVPKVSGRCFDLHGNLLDKGRVELEPYSVSQPGWAEQEVDYYWRGVCSACQQLWAKIGLDKQRVAGMALTTQRATVINLDATGRPLRPAITWLDQRRVNNLPPIGFGWDALLKVVGKAGMVNYFRREAESNWIRLEQPEIWRDTHKFILLSAYLNYKLCGEFVDSTASQVGYLPFDYRRQKWSHRFDWKWPATGINQSQLPELKPPGSLLGQVTAAAAQETGLPEGLSITADIFGLKVERPHTYETSGLGAVIDAAVGLGCYPDFDTAIERMTGVGKSFPPDPVAHQIYDQLYREVYCKMYSRLSPLYRSIQRITAYPKL